MCSSDERDTQLPQFLMLDLEDPFTHLPVSGFQEVDRLSQPLFPLLFLDAVP